MQIFGIPRLDAGAEGIHLVWSWPDTLPLSDGGYDIQRLPTRDERWPSVCETIDAKIIQYLRMRAEYPAPLGPLRMRTGAKVAAISSSGSLSLSTSALAASAATATLDVFIQELTVRVERASVEATGRIAIAMAMREGKVMQVVPSSSLPTTMQLQAPEIDTIVIYVLDPETLKICVYTRPDIKPGTPSPWDTAPYVVKGLTLPHNYTAAKNRLVAGESLNNTNFAHLTAILATAASATALGRSGERAVLTRAHTNQRYEEMRFDSQISALTLHPKMRRVLGFGFADRKGLKKGHTYVYRLTGRFRAEDLTDEIYDIHRVPASTALPAAFSIRDLSLRFQTPVKVVLDPQPSTTALHAVARRGIRIDTTGYDSSWVVPSLDSWSAILTFPRPVSDVVLEVAAGHSFTYAAGMPWSFGSPSPTPLGSGPKVALHFATPVLELRLAGTGTLYAVRIPSGATGVVEVHAYTQPITFAAQPLPEPPLWLSADVLQQPAAMLTGSIDESTAVAPRPPSGFKLRWLPAVSGGLGVWVDDLEAGPPLDALAYQIEHRHVTLPATYDAWRPIAGDDNLSLSSRDMSKPTMKLEYGCDLDEVFPSVRLPSTKAAVELTLSDVFGQEDPATGNVRPKESLGAYHQYQIRAMDAVGRVSSTTTLSNVARLEKHVPPPLPAGPQPEPGLDAKGHIKAPPGPRARAIIKDAPGLTSDDIALLGSHQNAILLEWGWRQHERDLDPTTAEFRVYSTRPNDAINAKITSVSSAPPHWELTLTTDLPLEQNELAGQWITSNGYPFLVTQNDAGTSVTMLVKMSQINPSLQPAVGAVTFGRPLRPNHQRPAGWDDRVAGYPLTASDTYKHVFYDVLTLSAAHPRDTVWVGVSAADAQPYVNDERTSGANSGRPGNESAIATCTIAARYFGQPTFSVPPPLGPVPELVTDEPTGRQILVALDLTVLLSGALAAGSPAVLERCSADDILSRTSVSGSDVILSHPDSTQETIAFPNPADHAAVLATLNSTNPSRLENRYLMHLIAASSDPHAFFERVSADIVQVGIVSDRLAPKPGRFLYFVRAADAQGHISAGGALLPIVVRVPSTASAAMPQRRALSTTDTSLTLTVAVPGDPDTTLALLFATFVPPNTAPPVQGEAGLLRIPNRRDLYPNDGLRLRLSDGTLIAPVLVKDLSDPDVTIEATGTRVAQLTTAAAKGAWATVWCYALTRDGFPSHACGPFGTGVHA